MGSFVKECVDSFTYVHMLQTWLLLSREGKNSTQLFDYNPNGIENSRNLFCTSWAPVYKADKGRMLICHEYCFSLFAVTLYDIKCTDFMAACKKIT